MPETNFNASARPTCDGGNPFPCPVSPTWKVREKGDSMERNWFYACAHHLHRVALHYDDHTEIDLYRIKFDDC